MKPLNGGTKTDETEQKRKTNRNGKTTNSKTICVTGLKIRNCRKLETKF